MSQATHIDNAFARGMVGCTIYFGYGSNLWRQQMRKRCPQSQYVGVARLSNYRWIINDRGYANIAETPRSGEEYTYGLVYTLSRSDEEKLDLNEGVPVAYTKEILEVEFWAAAGDAPVDVSDPAERIKVLVYINRERIEPDTPKQEYIYRMNQGIADAVQAGVPRAYVNEVLRKHIPEQHDKAVEGPAHEQAIRFVEETSQ